MFGPAELDCYLASSLYEGVTSRWKPVHAVCFKLQQPNHQDSHHTPSMADVTINIHDDAWMNRDLYGYGPNRPDAKWPGGAKIAVNCEWHTLSVHFMLMNQSYSTTRKGVREVSRTETSTPRPSCTSMVLLLVPPPIC